MLAQEDFTMEANLVYSVYLAGQTGRIADNKKHDYASHGGVAFVTHKTPSYVCQAGGTRRASARAASPSSSSAQGVVFRQDVLEAAGVIVSSKQPDAGTFLTPATAEH